MWRTPTSPLTKTTSATSVAFHDPCHRVAPADGGHAAPVPARLA